MRIKLTAVLIGWSVALSVTVAVAEPTPEFRGVWVTRFEWATPDPAECKARITQVFETLAAKNFNAAVFQIRGEPDTLYPSQIEPWSDLIGGKDPGFDPVAFAIEQAHKNGIAFHAYINAMPLRSLSWHEPPQDPKHLFNLHGPGSAEPWICVNQEGRPAKEDYYYLSAGVPQVQEYLRRVIRDVVQRYDVDGIHLDRIRYPGSEFSYGPISQRRFAGGGNPALLDHSDWQREQLTKFINDLAAEIRAAKPKVMLSCSAWGIYDRYHIPGYDGFSSGYHDYCQDTWNWCRIGAMDVLMPMIYWNIPNPKPNYDELLADFVKGVGPDHVAGGQMVFSPDENAKEIAFTRKTGALGTVLFSLRSARRRGVLDRAATEFYQEKTPPPLPARLKSPEFGEILGTVLADDGKPLVDAWVSLKTSGDAPEATTRRRRREGSMPTWISGADGRFAFLNVPPGQVRVVVKYDGIAPVEGDPINITVGQVTPTQITVPGAAALRDKPYVEIMRPDDNSSTAQSVVHILGRTIPGNHVSVGGKDVEVFSTGSFARDNIPLEPGANRIDVVVSSGSQSWTRTITITRNVAETRPANRPAETSSTQPAEVAENRIAETTAERTGITYGLHTVRLGGPWLAWVPKGTRLQMVARQGGNCRVQLSASMSGWVSQDDVRLLPAGTPPPHNYFTSLEVSGNDDHDILSMEMIAPVAVSVRSEIEPTNRLILDFFNTHNAATWLSHKTGAKILGAVRVEQIETDRVRVTVPIRSKQIWGYWTEIKDGRFTLRVRRPPTIAAAPASPLKGLLVAIEAGHGGSNEGAMGLLGTKEKNVTLAGAHALGRELEARGAKVIQVRHGDESISLSDRVNRANEANADLFVAVHANSAGSSRGYLATSGTSTYYHNIYCELAARRVYEKLLTLGWHEFGVVGDFSYTPIRNTRIPSILVEQAFMSHPGDEARLLDPQYQRQQAKAIADGLESFLNEARE